MSRRPQADVRPRTPLRRLAAGVAAVSALAIAAPLAAAAPPPHHGGGLHWTRCGEAHVLCARLSVPRDYDEPRGKRLSIAVAKSPATDRAHRIGSLVFNLGGPGEPGVEPLSAAGAQLAARLNRRFDIVGFDPRGVGRSRPAIDCRHGEMAGVYFAPIPSPLHLDTRALVRHYRAYGRRCLATNRGILSYVSTANVARDLDRLRRALGDRKLTYYGQSYGAFLGATYASMFPRRTRALVLDGPVDATRWINEPMQVEVEATRALERALARFAQACARDQVACSHFGGTDPRAAFEGLIDRADRMPLPAAGYTPDPRAVRGDDLRLAAVGLLYNRSSWGELGHALAAAAAGDGSEIRRAVDEAFFGGSSNPIGDVYFTVNAAERRFPQRGVGYYLRAGARCWSDFPHFWLSCGYVNLASALYPVRARDVFRGPFRIPGTAATPLVVATTHDPSTPYAGARRLVRDLRNARLLTMRGDAHGVYGDGERCIDRRVEAYLLRLALPPRGTVCRQRLRFSAPNAREPRGSA